eukprot:7650817-Alexandrium_andersonii.AAC.1
MRSFRPGLGWPMARRPLSSLCSVFQGSARSSSVPHVPPSDPGMLAPEGFQSAGKGLSVSIGGNVQHLGIQSEGLR